MNLFCYRFTDINLPKPFSNVCKTCYTELREAVEKGKAKAQDLPSSEDMLSSQSQPQSQFSNFSDTSQGQECRDLESKEAINSLLQNLTIAPIQKDEKEASVIEKMDLLKKKAYGLYNISEELEKNPRDDDLSKIIDNVKKRMSGKSYDERLIYLTIMPHDWPFSRFKEEFNVTTHCVRVIKDMQTQQIEKRERRKRGDAIDAAAIQRCEDFYRKPYISRELPGNVFINNQNFDICLLNKLYFI